MNFFVVGRDREEQEQEQEQMEETEALGKREKEMKIMKKCVSDDRMERKKNAIIFIKRSEQVTKIIITTTATATPNSPNRHSTEQ